jgi:phage terminase large subunit
VRNKVKITEKIPRRAIYREEILAIPQQKPNRKTFGIYPIRLGFYNVTMNKRETKFRWWLKNKVGEPPVVFDEERMERSLLAIQNYMFNKGFLHNEVEASYEEKKKKVTVTYKVIPDNRFFIEDIIFPEPTNLLNRTS